MKKVYLKKIHSKSGQTQRVCPFITREENFTDEWFKKIEAFDVPRNYWNDKLLNEAFEKAFIKMEKDGCSKFYGAGDSSIAFYRTREKFGNMDEYVAIIHDIECDAEESYCWHEEAGRYDEYFVEKKYFSTTHFNVGTLKNPQYITIEDIFKQYN